MKSKVKGLTQTSSLIAISASVTESAANTFTSAQVDLQLNPLDNEVFVVQAVDIDMFAPDLVTDTQSVTSFSLSSTQRTTVAGIDQPNVIAAKRIFTQNVGDTCAVTNEYASIDSPATDLEYVAIIATNDFFLNLEGAGNGSAKSANARVYGYRARADASVYAALVQSEALSA